MDIINSRWNKTGNYSATCGGLNSISTKEGRQLGEGRFFFEITTQTTGDMTNRWIGVTSLIDPDWVTGGIPNTYRAVTASRVMNNTVYGFELDLTSSPGRLRWNTNGGDFGQWLNILDINGNQIDLIRPAVGSAASINTERNFFINGGQSNFRTPLERLSPGTYSFDGSKKLVPEIPVNKSFILIGEGYKKYVEGRGAIDGSVNAIPVMTSNTAPSGVASASSNIDGYEAYKVFNRTNIGATDAWATLNSVMGWVAYKFNSKTAINKYSVTSRLDSRQQYSPKKWTLQASDDGFLTHGILDSRSNETGWTSNQKRTYEIVNSTSYLEYRLYIEENNGFSYSCIANMELFQVDTPATPPSWETVSPTVPTLPQFQSEGMDDLSIFDRKVQAVLESPQEMTSSVLGEGKVFKGTVNLKKYFDLRKLEVK